MITNPTNEHREQARETDPRDNGCLCQRCANRYRVDFMLPDELWTKIRGTFNLLCGSCIVELIEARKEFDYFDLIKTDARNTEIREVLEGLAKWVNDEWCWCPQVARDGNGALIHFDACVRTSTLYTRLQPSEKSLPGE